ncbi:glycoside hydrolase family 2 TIM barrel-domain containing protein [Gilvimarinus sp. 2_MG-2023]|uniref:glycoside hydrolase family 2 protein n=1 Tax=Gilvimarinus sp. 2_MG-2023 TaxID=3062666 RepID=UPI0026E304D9|nr:glycoside hydrolase family 2 TIM barrel-domain containing protein [Gilvimarinus sp. 2_MG-2023]MDO6571384.1 glycoside hydrolase family 2 TIM barrel-domain containing protein [Gilvimarinus sp. 2_MG-2023]
MKNIKILTLLAAVLSSLLISQVGYAEADRLLFNSDWQYSEVGVDKPSEVSENWQAINLPHTWNAKDTVDQVPGYRRGVSWYKKTFSVKKADRYFLHFEGSNMETDVYLNGEQVGSHIGGYIGFDVELTDAIKTRGENELVVRVSNAYNPHLIPSQKSDFFIHGGITRDVWLVLKNDTLIDRFEARAPGVEKEDYTTELTVFLDSAKKTKARLKASLISPEGAMVQSSEQEVVVAKGPSQQKITLDGIADAKLWSPESPSLYTIKVELLEQKRDGILDTAETAFGYRWFEQIPGQGFFVNGERLLLRGTHRHEEIAGVGAAMSNEQHRQDMQLIKNMGANLVRLGHYPQDPEVYRAADELGLILWDELPWCRGGKGGKQWEQYTEQLLHEQLAQNFNHASIAFWSLGNEIYWEEDFPGGGRDEILVPYLKKLNDIVKAKDSSRLTSIRKYYPGSDIVDSFSPSIWAGWYGGAYGQYEVALQNAQKKYPNMIHMEYGGSSHVGRHTETPIDAKGIRGAQVSVEEAVNQTVVKSVAKASDWNENYMVDLFDWHLMVSESLAGLTGTAQWAIRDFGTPLRPENPIPYVNQKGLFDRSGKRKDAYYVYASYWAAEPICYIESHTWTHRYGPAEGRSVDVYCNTDTAELFLNGESLGERKREQGQFPASGLVWQVPFKEGQNQLSVIGRNNGDNVARDETQVTYYVGEPGKFERLEVTQKMLENGNALIEVSAVDAEGRRLTNYSDRIYFSALGSNDALVDGFGSPGRSSVIEAADGYASIEVSPQANHPLVIQVKTQNVKGVFVEVAAR